MFLIKLFHGAGATGHVFFMKNGKTVDKGIAYSGFIVSTTTVAVVPTTSIILPFSVETRTKDKQAITVTGDIKISLETGKAVEKFDFTVNEKGSYLGEWGSNIRSIVIEKVLGPVHTKANSLNVDIAIQSQKDFETMIMDTMNVVNGNSTPLSTESTLLNKGIKIESCSVTKIEPGDDEIIEAIGSKEKEDMLTAADNARHGRRMESVKNDRAVKMYESATSKTVEEERAKLIEEQIKNKQREADGERQALKTRLEGLNETEPGKILGAALLDLAKSGRVNMLNIGPELMTALNQSKS